MTVRVGFSGMTHLGLNSAIAGADRGFEIICYDSDTHLIAALTTGKMPVQEPQLDALAARHKGKIQFTAEMSDLRRCDLVYVSPDIATDDRGHSDLSDLQNLLQVAFANTHEDTPIIVLSQVPPGFCRAHQSRGRVLIYQVETLIFGQAIDRALHPERYIIGLHDPTSPLPATYANYLKAHGNPPLFPMRYESAELAKIAINCCLVSSISVANMLAEICENIGANWAEIVPTLKLDRRIGPHSYLAPGLGISGGNLERDLETVLSFSARYGTDGDVAKAWIGNSKYRKNWPLRMLEKHVLSKHSDPAVGILGLTYKENTHSIKNSPSVQLIRQLNGYAIKAFDPAIRPSNEWNAKIVGQNSAEDVFGESDVVLLMTAWPEFRTLDPVKIVKLMRGKVVIDPFALLDVGQMKKAGLRHIVLGAGTDAHT